MVALPWIFFSLPNAATVFHTLTIAAFVIHYVGVSLATYSLR